MLKLLNTKKNLKKTKHTKHCTRQDNYYSHGSNTFTQLITSASFTNHNTKIEKYTFPSTTHTPNSRNSTKPISHSFQAQNTDDTFKQIFEQPKKFPLIIINFLAHDEPKNWIPHSFPFLSLQLSQKRLSSPNLRPHFFPLPVFRPSFPSNSPHKESDDSAQAVFNTKSHLIDPALDKTDEILDSVLSPTIF